MKNNILDKVTSEIFDVIVIGGGIVGSGIARDAAMRGLKVALFESNDFGFGTSSRTTKLLHGGLRYLAQGRIGLVSQASKEKLIIKQIAPHLAKPLKFVFPCWKGKGWPLWELRVGVKIYDFLASRRNFEKSGYLNISNLNDVLPGIRNNDLTGGVFYYDGLTNDSRLVIDTLKSAENHGAVILKKIRFIDGNKTNDHWEAHLVTSVSNKEIKVKTRTIVNATGPWGDMIKKSALRLRRTKGIHLIVPKNKFTNESAVVLPKGDRILFMIPFGNIMILGTTDTDYEGPLDFIKARKEEVEYILNVINEAFPKLDLSLEDVKTTFAGIRPLLGGKKGTPSDITRKHKITSPHPGWFDVGGGKLTTYRLMAEETVDKVLKYLNKKFVKSRTKHERLLEESDVKISMETQEKPTKDLVKHFCEEEWATDLEDIMVRRTFWQYVLDDPIAELENIALWMSEILGWSEEEKEKQISAYKAFWSIPFE